MTFRNALAHEADKILCLYDSVKGSEFCVWDDSYPTMLEIRQDLDTDNLYVMSEGEDIAGALSVMPEDEMDGFDCWRVRDGGQKEIARIVVSPDFRGRGLAGLMVQSIIPILKERGFRAVHISAAAVNTPALKTYARLGFEIMEKRHMYGHEYCLLEKMI